MSNREGRSDEIASSACLGSLKNPIHWEFQYDASSFISHTRVWRLSRIIIITVVFSYTNNYLFWSISILVIVSMNTPLSTSSCLLFYTTFFRFSLTNSIPFNYRGPFREWLTLTRSEQSRFNVKLSIFLICLPLYLYVIHL